MAALSQDPENRIRLQGRSQKINTILEEDWIAFDFIYAFLSFFTHNR